MYSDIDLGLVYLLLRTANRPLIRTKLNQKLAKIGQNQPIGFSLGQKFSNKTYFVQAHSFRVCTTDPYT